MCCVMFTYFLILMENHGENKKLQFLKKIIGKKLKLNENKN